MTSPGQNFTLHDMYDGEDPKIDLDPEVAVAIKERTDELRDLPLCMYVCEQNHRTAMRRVHIGATPMMIECPTCSEPAKTSGFVRITAQERKHIEQRNREIEEHQKRGVPIIGARVQEIGTQPPWLAEMPVTYEWFRPSADDFDGLTDEEQQYVMRGGLVLREVVDE